MARDTVIVDLDGTVVDTRARHHAAYGEIVRKLGGEPLPLPAFWRAKRRGVGWAQLLGPLDASSFLAIWGTRIEAADMLALDRLQPGAALALRRLAGHGKRRVLITARRDTKAMARQLEALALDSAFETTIATGGAPKHLSAPEPERVQRWIGDTEEDVAAARAIGASVTGVTNGIRCPSLLRRAEPDDLAPSFASAVRRLLR
ncbi:MAG: Haloacid dehalogenase domain protein hydrolase [Phenylobacterium sp.]|nr:Haloacid dehalogenase domain protein hydrolase [Phenylobacterium sp.]